jgi:phosphatidylserine decarboxylase
MLDSLGSTLTRTTVNSFFTRFGKNAHEDELTVDEVIMCLETELDRPDSEKRRLDADDSLPDTSVSATPILSVAGRNGENIDLDKLDFSGPPMIPGSDHTHRLQQSGAPHRSQPYTTEAGEQPLSAAAEGGQKAVSPQTLDRQPFDASELEESSDSMSGSEQKTEKRSKYKGRFKKGSKGTSSSETQSTNSSDSVERVINVQNCPLCHRPRLNSKAEVDIVTHLAVCASQDWAKVDRIVVGNFVTASQAQRKWYTKIIGKLSSGDYRLGAVSDLSGPSYIVL